MNKNRQAPDLWSLICILALLAIGIVMVYSAGSVLAFHDYGDKFYFVKRQLFLPVWGLLPCTSHRGPTIGFGRNTASLHCWSAFMLIIVLIPGIGVVRGGARSWLGISSFGIQPPSL